MNNPSSEFNPLDPATLQLRDLGLHVADTVLRPTAGRRADDRALPAIGGYDVARQLGRGGMGIVYLAREQSLNRWVAIKVLVGGAFADIDAMDRFQREAEAFAGMQHPNIVQIFRIGSSDLGSGQPPCPYIALEYADGGTLADHVGKPVSPRLAAELVAKLSDAMHYAHGRGVVHRDLKPANVLLQIADADRPMPGDLANAIPKITDFGLAKRLEPGQVSNMNTVAGTMLGTPEYMSPEQASGQPEVGPAADVYALGVILFELLTGRVPIQGSSALDTMILVRSQEPVSPSRLQSNLPRDLDTICLCCLQKDPARRYRSAAALGDDLRAWLDGRPIAARPIGVIERTTKWAKRRPTVAMLLAAVVASAVIGFAGVSWQWSLANERAVAERDARQDADLARIKAEDNVYFGRISLAQQELNAGDYDVAVQLLNACRPKANEVDRRNWEWRYLNRISRCHLVSFKADDNWAFDVAFSPDGKFLATASGTAHEVLNRTTPGKLALWDSHTGRLVRRFAGHGGAVRQVRFNSDGTRLASAALDGTLRIWDPSTGEQIGQVIRCIWHPEGHRLSEGDINCFWFSPDGRAINVLTERGWVWIDIESRAERALPWPAGIMQVSADGRRAAVRQKENSIKIIDAENGQTLNSLQYWDFVDRMALNFDGSGAALSTSESVQWYEVDSGQAKYVVPWESIHWIETLQFDRLGQSLAAGGAGRRVHIWKPMQSVDSLSFAGHSAEIRKVEFAKDGKRLASCDRNGNVFVWDLTQNPRRQLLSPKDAPARIHAVGLSADGSEVVMTHCRQHLIRVGADGRNIAELPLPEITKRVVYPRTDVRFDSEAAYVVGPVDEKENVARRWNAKTAEVMTEYRGHTHSVYGVAISYDSKRLATHTHNRKSASSDAPEILIWDIESGRQLGRIPSERLVGMALCRDGSRLVGVNLRGEIVFWNTTTGYELSRRQAHGDGKSDVIVFAVAWSPDDRHVATASYSDGMVRMWNAETFQPHLEPMLARPSTTGVAFTPDGKRLAAGGYDSDVRFWDVATGLGAISLAPPSGHRRSDIAFTAIPLFSKTGHRLAMLDWRGSIGVWDASE